MVGVRGLEPLVFLYLLPRQMASPLADTPIWWPPPVTIRIFWVFSPAH